MGVAEGYTKLRSWCRNLLRRARVERELDDELTGTLDMLIEEKRAQGLSPQEARRAAMIELGGVEQIKEEIRHGRSGAGLERLWYDTRTAARSLARARGFAIVALVTLAVGMALCTITVSVVNAYFVRGLPYPAADRLYSVQYGGPDVPSPDGLEALEWSALGNLIEHAISWDLDMFYLTGESRPERAPGAWITPSFIDGFGIRPVVGRNFEPADFNAGGAQVALISHRLWRGRFGGDADIVGRRFQAYVSDRPEEAETFTIVGVLPERLWHLNTYTDILVPLVGPRTPYVFRLREGVTPASAADGITAMVHSSIDALDSGWRVGLVSTQARYLEEMRPVVRSVVIAVGLVFLITSANVAMLFLMRAKRKEHETAVRLALGGSRWRVGRHLVLEAVLLGGGATLLGLAVGRTVLAWLGPGVEQQLGRSVPGGLEGFGLDATVIAGTIALGLLSTAGFVLVPVVTAWRTSPGLARTGAAHSDAANRSRLRSVLVAGEVAGSLALLTASVFLVASAYRMLQVDFGIDAERTLTASLSLRHRSYPDAQARTALFGRLMDRFDDVPGVQTVAVTSVWPFQAPNEQPVTTGFGGEGARADAGVVAVSPAYFDTLDIPILEGRGFERTDRWDAERVVVVSETLARRLANGRPVVGQRLRLGGGAPVATDERDAGGHLVVGVVADVRQAHADESLADAYVPILQEAPRFAYVLARVPTFSPTWDDELWAAVADVDASISLGTPDRLQSGFDEERARPRFLASLLSAFAGFAALLALVGVYSVISYSVRQRRREVALRMAVGAAPTAVVRMFVRQGAQLLGTGLVVGLAAAIAISRALESQFYTLRATDPWVLGLTALAFGACGLLAILWPAARATALDPAITLRSD